MDFLFIPMFSDANVVRVIIKIFWVIFLFTGISFIAETRKHRLLFYAIPILQIITGLLDVISTNPVISFVNTGMRMACFILLIGLVLVRVFLPGPVTVYRILGGVAVYILLGNLYAEGFYIIYRFNAAAFNLPANGFIETNPFPTFLYFSFITLTTTGFGEISPVIPAARSIVQIEALTGVLYPAILISRLVSGSIESSKP